MTDAEIRETIFTVLGDIAPEADPSALAPHEDMREALNIDSFDHLNVLIGLHEALGVEIPEADYGELTTLEGMITYLAARVG